MEGRGLIGLIAAIVSIVGGIVAILNQLSGADEAKAIRVIQTSSPPAQIYEAPAKSPEEKYWDLAAQENSALALNDYIRQYPEGQYVMIARSKLDALKVEEIT